VWAILSPQPPLRWNHPLFVCLSWLWSFEEYKLVSLVNIPNSEFVYCLPWPRSGCTPGQEYSGREVMGSQSILLGRAIYPSVPPGQLARLVSARLLYWKVVFVHLCLIIKHLGNGSLKLHILFFLWSFYPWVIAPFQASCLKWLFCWLPNTWVLVPCAISSAFS
jgi:hypothetical protein